MKNRILIKKRIVAIRPLAARDVRTTLLNQQIVNITGDIDADIALFFSFRLFSEGVKGSAEC